MSFLAHEALLAHSDWAPYVACLPWADIDHPVVRAHSRSLARPRRARSNARTCGHGQLWDEGGAAALRGSHVQHAVDAVRDAALTAHAHAVDATLVNSTHFR